MAAVAPRPSSPPSDIPELDPAYVRDEDLGAAIALDAAGHADESLIGAATHTAHWAEHAEVVRVVPPPPEEMTLVTEPGVMTDRERDLMLARRLYEMRVTIVGGTHSDGTCRRLMDRFLLDPEQIRWIECEKGRQPPLESLRGIRKDHDVLVCITGAIGHAESEKTIRIGRRGGVEAIYVESASRIPEGLRNALLGS